MVLIYNCKLDYISDLFSFFFFWYEEKAVEYNLKKLEAITKEIKNIFLGSYFFPVLSPSTKNLRCVVIDQNFNQWTSI